MNRLQQLLWQEKGVTTLYIALALPVLLGMVALALDGSNAYLQRRRMQNAADFAALAGAQALALGGDTSTIGHEIEALALANGVGNTPWLIDADNKRIQFTSLGRGQVDWRYTADHRGVQVTVNNDYEPFFARIFGYELLSANGRGGAGYLPVVGVRNLLPLAVNGCDCVSFDTLPASLAQSDFGSTVLAVYTIGNVSDSAIAYVLSVKNLDPTYPANVSNRPYYMLGVLEGQGRFTVYSDGTAHAVAKVANVNGDGFAMDLRFRERITRPPDEQSPACTGACPDTSDWQYYPTITGLLTGLPGTRYAGAVIQVTRRGAAMQVGTNAHLKSPAAVYGNAAWLNLDVIQQPTTGVILRSQHEDAATAMHLLPLDAAADPVEDSPSASTCSLYPIAVSAQTLSGATPGARLGDLWNGVQPGNFGWLTWAGAPDVPTLALSLTPPGNSQTYINPNNPADRVVSLGDWVKGSPGVANAAAVRAALDVLKTLDITVPVWDQVSGSGSNARYRVSNFAVVRITDYRLPNQNRITATFVGYAPNCGSSELPPATPTPVATPTPPPTASCALAAAETTFNRYNLIVLDDLATSANVETRTYVGGNWVGPTAATLATGVQTVAASEPMLVVVGNLVVGAPLTMNAGSFSIGGNTNGRTIHFVGGGSLLQDLSLFDTEITALLRAASAQLAQQPPNNGVILPLGQAGAAHFNVSATTPDGVAIFQVAADDLFSNALVQELRLNPSVATTVVINVTGTTVDWRNRGNLADLFTTSAWAGHVIWNFTQATAINLHTHTLMGTLLAPYANVTTAAPLQGTIAVRALTTSSAVRQPTFSGNLRSLCAEDDDAPAVDPPCQLAWLDWDGGVTSTGELIQALHDPGGSGLHRLGEWVAAGPAVTDAPAIANALARWLNQVALIVLYDKGNQEQGYQICGFAALKLTDYDFADLPPWLQGQFVPALVNGLTDPQAPDYGLRDLRFK